MKKTDVLKKQFQDDEKGGVNTDIREFVKKQETALRRYRFIYRFLNFAAITIFLYLLLFYLNLDKAFPSIKAFEVRASTSYDIAGISISFGTLALILISSFVSLIITALLTLREDRTGAIIKLESKYPGLYEKLRTGYDNAGIDNLIVKDLLGTIASGIEHVAPSALFVMRRAVFGIVIICIATVSTVYVVHYDIRSDTITAGDWKNTLDNIFGGDSGSSDGLQEFDNGNGDNSSSENENLTGDLAVIVVEGTPVDLTLPAGSGEGFEDTGDSEEADTNFDKSSPYEISVISSQSYYEELPEGYESVIKSYFEEMAQD